MINLPDREKWNWRPHLTPDEAEFMRRSDEAAARISEAQKKFNKEFEKRRRIIVKRAVKRAKRAAAAQ